jgi:hypothetical protein
MEPLEGPNALAKQVLSQLSYTPMQPHDCNGFLVRMSSCFLRRHSSSTKSNCDARLGAFANDEGVLYKGSGTKPTSILRFGDLK